MYDIDKRDVVVIDDIPSPPLVGEAYIASNLLIIVCQQGAILNDEVPEFALRTHDVSILMPDQIMLPKAITPDLRCTNIAISRRFYERLLHQYSLGHLYILSKMMIRMWPVKPPKFRK